MGKRQIYEGWGAWEGGEGYEGKEPDSGMKAFTLLLKL